MTGGRNDDTYTRVSGRERGGEIPMRLKLTAAGWIPNRGSEKVSLTVCEGLEEYRKNVRDFYMSKLFEAAGAFFRSRRGNRFIEHPHKIIVGNFYEMIGQP